MIRFSDVNLRQKFIGVVLITPDEARHVLLTLNSTNRRGAISPSTVRKCKALLTSGDWQPEHPGRILFNTEGNVADGQHRLSAIVEYGQPVLVSIETLVPLECEPHIDGHSPRAMNWRVRLSDESNAMNKYCVAITKVMAEMRRGVVSPSLSVRQCESLFAQHSEAIVFAASVLSRKLVGVSRAPVALAVAEMYERNATGAADFVGSLFDPDGTIQQARRLREWLLSNASRKVGGAGGRAVIYGRSVFAMKSYLSRRPISGLREGSWE